MAVAQTNLEAKFVRRALEKDGGKSDARERGGRAREFLPSAISLVPFKCLPRRLQHSGLTRPSPLCTAHGGSKGFLFPITPSTEITGEELASETRVGGYHRNTIRASDRSFVNQMSSSYDTTKEFFKKILLRETKNLRNI